MLLVVVSCAAGAFGEELAPGPWGRVELVPVQIRIPASMLTGVPLPVSPWIAGADLEGARRSLSESGVEKELADRILATHDAREGGVLRPTPEMSRELGAVARGRLYERLRAEPGNAAQLSPHRFRRERLARRFRQITPDTLRILEGFFYERPGAPDVVYFADLPAVTHLLSDPEERVRVIQSVSEQDSVILRLNVDSSSSPEALAEYWGRGGRRRDIEILIASLKEPGAPEELDVIYLLPPFARAFLLTYPRVENAARRDCFWTALNFFLPSPDDSLEGPLVGRALVERYEPVTDGAPRLGDVLVLWRRSGEAEHAAVYIAGDVYFTKNGNGPAVPWLFMPLADILERYDDAERESLVHYRLKNLD